MNVTSNWIKHFQGQNYTNWQIIDNICDYWQKRTISTYTQYTAFHATMRRNDIQTQTSLCNVHKLHVNNERKHKYRADNLLDNLILELFLRHTTWT